MTSPTAPPHLLYSPHDLASLSGGVQWSTHFLISTLQSWDQEVFCLSYSRPELVPEHQWIELPRPVRRMTGFPRGSTERFRRQIEAMAPRSIMLSGISIVADLTFLRACVPEQYLNRTAALWKSSIDRSSTVFEDLGPVAKAAAQSRERILRRSRFEIARRVGYNVVFSPHLTEDLQAAGVSADRILFAQEPVAGLVSPELRAKGGACLRSRYLDDDEFGVLVSSRIQVDKGLTWLPVVANHLERRLRAGAGPGRPSRVRITVAGNIRSTELHERLLRETQDLDETIRVDFLGHQPKEIMAELYATHDLLLHPSPEEGFGRAFIEAMQSGMGVVGNLSCRSLTHILRASDAETGTQARNPAEAAAYIWDVLSDPQRCRQIGNNAQAWATTEFAAERATDDLRTMMAALVAE